MQKFFKKVSLIFVLGLVSACSSNVKQDNVAPRVVAELPVFEYKETEVISNDNDNIEQTKQEKYFSTKSEYDGKMLYKEVEKQVKKVELKKKVIKPVYDTENHPISLDKNQVKQVIKQISSNPDFVDGVEYKDKNVKALMENYQNILKTSYSCCVVNIAEELKHRGVSKESIVQFLKFDAEEFALQNMCIVVDDSDINDVYGNKLLTEVVAKSKNSCICNNAEFLKRNIDNFYKIYNMKPELYNEVLVYRFKDKNGRIVEHDINETVLNISTILNSCVK